MRSIEFKDQAGGGEAGWADMLPKQHRSRKEPDTCVLGNVEIEKDRLKKGKLFK